MNSNTNIPLPQDVVPKKDNTSKNSKLSVLALVFSILGCTFFVGIILAIIDLTKKDGRKKTLSIIALVIAGIWLLSAFVGGDKKENETTTTTIETEVEETNNIDKETEEKVDDIIENLEQITEEPKEEIVKEEVVEEKTIYNVGETYQDDVLKMIYSNAYEFTDFNDFNMPKDNHIVICMEFEFENISDSDKNVMYTDFNGYADGYEVQQSYAPDGTGIEFSVTMSPGRKGKGIVAFEVPKDSKEIQVEFSPNMFSSEKIIFEYK